MALAIDITDGRGLSNEACCEFLPKKSICHSVRSKRLTNKMECFSFKSGCTMWVAKFIKEDWPIVLQ